MILNITRMWSYLQLYASCISKVVQYQTIKYNKDVKLIFFLSSSLVTREIHLKDE